LQYSSPTATATTTTATETAMPAPAPSPYPPRQRIGILVFDDFEPLDVWGFCEAFSIARFLGTAYAESEHLPFELVLISNQEGRVSKEGGGPHPVKSYNGPRVAPDMFRNQALLEHFDVLMVPGGFGTRSLVNNVGLGEWLRAMDQRVALMASVCSGAALLAKAGLLDGKAAATNHASFAWVAQQGPLVLWDNVARWVDAGRYVTSAGVSAGTDMAFYLVQRLAGRAVAEAAALAAEYDWQRNP
jgi:putative intracellular protease/amidase